MQHGNGRNETSLIRMACIIFASLFSKIYVRQYDNNGAVKDYWNVPIVFSAKQAYDEYAEQTIRTPSAPIPEFGRRFPRMAYDFLGMTYNADAQLSPWVKTVKNQQDKKSKYIYSPVAYILQFELNIYCTDMDSSIQILDSIIPYFKPEVSVKLKEQREIPIINDICIELTGISKDDNYLSGLDTNRLIIWTLSFDMNANYWVKSASDSKPINEVIIDIQDSLLHDNHGFDNLPELRKSDPKYQKREESCITDSEYENGLQELLNN